MGKEPSKLSYQRVRMRSWPNLLALSGFARSNCRSNQIPPSWYAGAACLYFPNHYRSRKYPPKFMKF